MHAVERDNVPKMQLHHGHHANIQIQRGQAKAYRTEFINTNMGYES